MAVGCGGEQCLAIANAPRPLRLHLLEPCTALPCPGAAQIQADVGQGHSSIIEVYQAILTPTHLCLVSAPASDWASTPPAAARQPSSQGPLPSRPQVMECAYGGCLTEHVADRAAAAYKERSAGLVVSEDQARYFFKASAHRG